MPPQVTLDAKRSATIMGWAVDRPSEKTASSVFLAIDGKAVESCVYGGPRPDVATALGGSQYTNSSFTCSLKIGEVKVGHHSLGLMVVNAANNAYYNVTSKTKIVVQTTK